MPEWHLNCGLMCFTVIYWLEKKFIKFKSTGFNLKGVILNLIGLIPLCFIIKYSESFLVSNNILDVYWAKFTSQFIFFGYVMLVWPYILNKLKINNN